MEYCESPWEFSAAPETLRKCRSLLSQRINQMGFHHMFKVFKKIGKGNFASVSTGIIILLGVFGGAY